MNEMAGRNKATISFCFMPVFLIFHFTPHNKNLSLALLVL